MMGAQITTGFGRTDDKAREAAAYEMLTMIQQEKVQYQAKNQLDEE